MELSSVLKQNHLSSWNRHILDYVWAILPKQEVELVQIVGCGGGGDMVTMETSSSINKYMSDQNVQMEYANWLGDELDY